MTEIGDWDAASLLLRTNLTERFDTDIDLFLSGSWSHTKASRTSENPFYKFMGMGLLNSNGELEDRDGYMIYLGAVFPMPWEGKFGLEYNYGSKVLVQLHRRRGLPGGQQAGGARQRL